MHNWAILLGSVAISGGTNVIFEHALRAAASGVSITFVTEESVKREDFAWHPIGAQYSSASICWRTFRQVANERFDVAIATWWGTYFWLWKVEADYYFYFVQSIESRFCADDERVVRSLVESTYQLPVGFVTEAKWIKQYLSAIHKQEAQLALNGINKAIFREDGPAVSPRREGRLRVLVEGAIEVPFKNVPRTITLCRRSQADEVWLLTPSNCQGYPGVDRVFSRVPIEKTAEIYRSCDVVVKLSYVEGMSLPPLEMFHCGGTCIVYDVTGHNEYIVHERNGLIGPADDEDRVVSYLNDLKRCSNLLRRLKQGALHTAENWIDWGESSRQFVRAVQGGAASCRVSREQLATYSKRCWRFYVASDREKSDWREQIERLHGELSTAQAGMAERQREITEIYNSTSWRITAPLRGLKKAFLGISKLPRSLT